MIAVAVSVFTFAEILIIPAISSILITYIPDGMRVGILSWNAIAVALGEGSGKWIGVNVIASYSQLKGNNPFLLLMLLPLSGIVLIITFKFILNTKIGGTNVR